MIPFLSRATISSTTLWAELKLKQFSDTPRLEAEVLLAFLLKKPKEFLYRYPQLSLSKNTISKYKSLITNRTKHMPVAYLTKSVEFYNNSFIVSKDTLIPRPETENLVDFAISKIKKIDAFQPQILEVGTGTGCIALTLKQEVPNSFVTATDFSKKALVVARKNAKALKLNVEFKLDDIFKTKLSKHKFDLIISNPPYIPAPEYLKLQKEVLQEPKSALVGGKDGLDYYRHFAQIFPTMLTEHGIVLLEIHAHFAKSTLALFNKDFKGEVIKDDAGRDRILFLTKKDSR